MLVYYALAVIVIVLGVLSLKGGVQFVRFVRHELKQPLSDYTPFVSVIAPCRGLEDGLEDNLRALFQQDYPGYEIVFVLDHANDPAREIIDRVIEASQRNIHARMVIAGSATDRGQKVHNLTVATTDLDRRTEVIVFVDSDARTKPTWLRSLVSPLVDEKIGAATGYRWFVPSGGFTSHVRSVWNASIASALGAKTSANFCWGGSTAIRRDVFEELKVRENWRGTISDDFSLMHTLHEANRPIVFVPRCLVPAVDSCTFGELIKFTNRQLKITRVYAPNLWRPVLIGSLLFCLAFFGGIVLIIARVWLGLDVTWVLLTVAIIFLLGSIKGFIRFQAVERAIGRLPASSLFAHVSLWPVTSALYLWNAIVALFSQRLEWRGITYELKSPHEAVIIRRQDSHVK